MMMMMMMTLMVASAESVNRVGMRGTEKYRAIIYRHSDTAIPVYF